MNSVLVDRIVNTLLYEGYMLYPYRPALKNRQRWTFGGLYPQSWSQANDGTDGWYMQMECLVQGDAATTIRVRTRFLHLLNRLIGQLVQPRQELGNGEEPALRLVDKLQVGDRLLHTWQEACERQHLVEDLDLVSLLAEPVQREFNFAANRQLEAVHEPHAPIHAFLIRQQNQVAGLIRICATRLNDGLFKVHVRIENKTPLQDAGACSRDEALMRALLSTHILLEVNHGSFISLIDPPESMRVSAASCANIGAWPVLVGEEGEANTMLAAPIILYDYPQIAPESAGDLFDSTEIDEILTLRIMTLTDEEKQTAAAVDERARAILQRTASLDSGDLFAMHGVIRGLQLTPGGDGK